MEYINYNFNWFVKVKLNNLGRYIYYHQYDHLDEEFLSKCPPKYPEIDEDGYTCFQMWHLMNLYGGYMFLGKETPFEIASAKIEVR